MTVVTNSGPLIALAKLNRLDLLPSLYGEVIIPQAVYGIVKK
jgi:predicted nucleic acid-binding protein